MAASKTKKPVKPRKPTGRKKSKLTLIGEEAQRKALLATLKERDWNLSATAEALDLGGSGNVIRAIHALGLDEEYEKARAQGKITPGPRSVSD